MPSTRFYRRRPRQLTYRGCPSAPFSICLVSHRDLLPQETDRRPIASVLRIMSSPASELPVELLQRIFSFLPEIPPIAPRTWKKNVEYALAPPLPPTATDDKPSRRGWADAAAICRHWREVAFAMNRTIPIRIAPEEANKDIRRNVPSVFAPLPVVIHVEQHLLEGYVFGHGRPRYIYGPWPIVLDSEGPRSEPLLRMLNALAGRVRGIYVYLCTTISRQRGIISMTPHVLQFLRLAVQMLPSFHELHLIAPGRNHRHGLRSTSYTPDGVLNFPADVLDGRDLSTLELRDCHFADRASVFAHTNLRRLTLIASTDSWPLPSTANLKQLEYLCLTLESIPKKSTIASMDTIELPSLKNLHLGGYMYNVGALLAKLSFPASTSIVLRCEYNANTVTEHLCPLVTPLADHLEGSCARGGGFTHVAMRVNHLETEVVCSAPFHHRASSSLLSPSTSITVSLGCRLRNVPAALGQTYTTEIFEDLLTGICIRLPHAAFGDQTLEVTLPSPGSVGPAYTYWLEAASSLADVTDVLVDGQAAHQLLEFVETRRARQADVPFPHLHQLKTTARRARPDDVQKLHQLLRDEAGKRGVNCAVPLEDVRVD
ncbi:hypothetical protein PENSPDRAFT_655997 [Peniophora sp. CONT]|nr:hypothetical protein PENSPDRAFT_655997 [Peniophora sp. CONT]